MRFNRKHRLNPEHRREPCALGHRDDLVPRAGGIENRAASLELHLKGVRCGLETQLAALVRVGWREEQSHRQIAPHVAGAHGTKAPVRRLPPRHEPHDRQIDVLLVEHAGLVAADNRSGHVAWKCRQIEFHVLADGDFDDIEHVDVAVALRRELEVLLVAFGSPRDPSVDELRLLDQSEHLCQLVPGNDVFDDRAEHGRSFAVVTPCRP